MPNTTTTFQTSLGTDRPTQTTTAYNTSRTTTFNTTKNTTTTFETDTSTLTSFNTSTTTTFGTTTTYSTNRTTTTTTTFNTSTLTVISTDKQAILWRTDDASDGDGAIYNWNQTTTMADPGSGIIRGNNSNVGSITKLAMSATDADGTSQYNVLEALRANGGRIRLRDSSDSENVSFRITGGTDNTSWFEFDVDEQTLLPIGSDTLPTSLGVFDNGRILDCHAARTDGGGWSTNTTTTYASHIRSTNRDTSTTRTTETTTNTATSKTTSESRSTTTTWATDRSTTTTYGTSTTVSTNRSTTTTYTTNTVYNTSTITNKTTTTTWNTTTTYTTNTVFDTTTTFN